MLFIARKNYNPHELNMERQMIPRAVSSVNGPTDWNEALDIISFGSPDQVFILSNSFTISNLATVLDETDFFDYVYLGLPVQNVYWINVHWPRFKKALVGTMHCMHNFFANYVVVYQYSTCLFSPAATVFTKLSVGILHSLVAFFYIICYLLLFMWYNIDRNKVDVFFLFSLTFPHLCWNVDCTSMFFSIWLDFNLLVRLVGWIDYFNCVKSK